MISPSALYSHTAKTQLLSFSSRKQWVVVYLKCATIGMPRLNRLLPLLVHLGLFQFDELDRDCTYGDMAVWVAAMIWREPSRASRKCQGRRPCKSTSYHNPSLQGLKWNMSFQSFRYFFFYHLCHCWIWWRKGAWTSSCTNTHTYTHTHTHTLLCGVFHWMPVLMRLAMSINTCQVRAWCTAGEGKRSWRAVKRLLSPLRCRDATPPSISPPPPPPPSACLQIPPALYTLPWIWLISCTNILFLSRPLLLFTLPLHPPLCYSRRHNFTQFHSFLLHWRSRSNLPFSSFQISIHPFSENFCLRILDTAISSEMCA